MKYNNLNERLISIFLIFFLVFICTLLIYESKVDDGVSTSSRLISANCGVLLCNGGDTTIFYHPDSNIGHNVYMLLFAIGSLLAFINILLNRTKMKMITFIMWLLFFLISFVPQIVLRLSNGFALSLSAYFDAFVTFSFDSPFIYIIWGSFIGLTICSITIFIKSLIKQ